MSAELVKIPYTLKKYTSKTKLPQFKSTNHTT